MSNALILKHLISKARNGGGSDGSTFAGLTNGHQNVGKVVETESKNGKFCEKRLRWKLIVQLGIYEGSCEVLGNAVIWKGFGVALMVFEQIRADFKGRGVVKWWEGRI